MKKAVFIFALAAALLAAATAYAQAMIDGPSVQEMELWQEFPTPPPPLANRSGVKFAKDRTVSLEVAGNYAAVSFGSFTMELLQTTLADWSGGTIQLLHYTDSILGSDKEIFEAVRRGSIAMGFMTSAPQYEYIPELAVFDMGGFPVEHEAAARTMRQGPFRDAINAAYAKAGMELVALFPTCYRELGSTFPVRTFDDLRKLRIRVMENPHHADFWQCMGAEATQKPMTDSYISLQQRLLNASENPLDTHLASRFYEQTAYFTETHHILFNNTLICNKKIWDALPESYRAMIRQAALRVGDWATATGPERAKVAREKLRETGCEIIPFSEQDRQRMHEAAAPHYERVRKAAGSALVDLWIEELKKNAGRGQ